ncbi:hypothetical protein GCM10007924_10630 [Sneathiella chinensis]|uniref:Uncharacterized protein n=3 Tax=Alphaproteobacteria TaxID=28211 RepID=A0ABQ5U159_9PROT|nr:hypothetical protein GCM10007924_10630 [Sneathiella chinensis]
MSSHSSIPVGSHVVLEVDATEDIILARIVALNGEKLASPPTVRLLPTLPSHPQQGDPYGLHGKPALSQPLPDMQSLATALTKREGATPPAPSSPLPPFPSAPSPGNTASAAPFPLTGPKITTPPQIGDMNGLVGRAPSQSQGAAAYAHTTPPSSRPPLPTGGIPPGMTGAASLTTPDGAPLNPPLLVRATIRQPALNSPLQTASGPFNLSQGAALSVIVSAQNSAPSTHPNAPVFSGTVIGTSGASGAVAGATGKVQIFVQTNGLGTLSFTAPSSVPVGSTVFLAVPEADFPFPLSRNPDISSIFKTPHLPILTEWENLRNSLNELASHNPALAKDILNTRIPSANTNLSSSLLFFISALNGGNMEKWLGQDARQALETAGRRDLLQALSDDFTSLSRLAADPGGQDWKLLPFPFYDGEALQQLRMFYRHRSGSGKDKEEAATRFVIELDLSRTGPIQLDGLFKKARFDLAVRSQAPVDDAVQKKIQGIFTENLEITGIAGTLTFRQTVPFPVHPLEEWEDTQHKKIDV